DKIQATPYDPDKAKQLLSQAGLGSGFSIKFSPEPPSTMLAVAVQGFLQKVGINAEIKQIDQAGYNPGFTRGTLEPLSLGAIGSSPLLDADASITWFTSAAPTKFFANPQLDMIFASSRTEADPAKRASLLQQAITLLHDEVAMIPLYNTPVP